VVKVTIKKIISVHDFDKLVQETYGRPYSFQQQDDCKERGLYSITVPYDEPYDYENDTVPEVINHEEMGVSFKAWLERDPTQKLSTATDWNKDYGLVMWYERNFYPSEEMIVNDLYEKGLLEAGEYEIDVDW
jgi:hypothetical protein